MKCPKCDSEATDVIPVMPWMRTNPYGCSHCGFPWTTWQQELIQKQQEELAHLKKYAKLNSIEHASLVDEMGAEITRLKQGLREIYDLCESVHNNWPNNHKGDYSMAIGSIKAICVIYGPLMPPVEEGK